MNSGQCEVVELHGRQSCHYQLANPWNQPLGRIGEFLQPILLDPQNYVVEPGARLVSSNLVGVDRRRRIVEETLHLKEIDGRLRRKLRLRSLLPPKSASPARCAPWWTAANGAAAITTGSWIACPV